MGTADDFSSRIKIQQSFVEFICLIRHTRVIRLGVKSTVSLKRHFI